VSEHERDGSPWACSPALEARARTANASTSVPPRQRGGAAPYSPHRARPVVSRPTGSSTTCGAPSPLPKAMGSLLPTCPRHLRRALSRTGAARHPPRRAVPSSAMRRRLRAAKGCPEDARSRCVVRSSRFWCGEALGVDADPASASSCPLEPAPWDLWPGVDRVYGRFFLDGRDWGCLPRSRPGSPGSPSERGAVSSSTGRGRCSPLGRDGGWGRARLDRPCRRPSRCARDPLAALPPLALALLTGTGRQGYGPGGACGRPAVLLADELGVRPGAGSGAHRGCDVCSCPVGRTLDWVPPTHWGVLQHRRTSDSCSGAAVCPGRKNNRRELAGAPFVRPRASEPGAPGLRCQRTPRPGDPATGRSTLSCRFAPRRANPSRARKPRPACSSQPPGSRRRGLGGGVGGRLAPRSRVRPTGLGPGAELLPASAQGSLPDPRAGQRPSPPLLLPFSTTRGPARPGRTGPPRPVFSILPAPGGSGR